MAKLVLVSGDLMVAARVEGAARKCGVSLATVAGHAPAIAAGGDDWRVALIDLRSPGLDLSALVAELRQLPRPPTIIAFGPHVHEQRLEEARRAGCDMVISRGQLDRDAEAILAQYL